MFIKIKDLAALGLNADVDKNAVQYGRELYVSCRNIPDMVCTFDPKKLRLSMLSSNVPAVRPQQNTAVDLLSSFRKKELYVPRENSLFLNYGLTYVYADQSGFQSFEMNNKIGARTGSLFFTSDSLYTRTPSHDSFVRLMSTATYERPDTLQWLSFGDTFAYSGDLGSTINLGGLSISKVYMMDPYFVKQPLFGFAGSLTAPSQVDIYADGALVRSFNIRPGDFEIRNLYTQLGSGSVDIYIKDPYGNVQKVNYPVYGDTVLLRKGLHDYSYNMGFLRENYGLMSNQYGKPAFSAYHRYGLTDAFNIKARAEAAEGLYNGGIQALSVIPRLGVFRMDIAESVKGSRRGVAGSFLHNYQKGFFNTSLFFTRYTEDYLTIGSLLTGQQVKRTAGFLAGFGSMAMGNFSLGYSKEERFGGISSRAISSTYSKMLLKNLQMNLSARMTKGTDTDYAVFAGLTYYFFSPHDNTTRIAAQYQQTKNGDSESVQAQKDPPPRGEGGGYRLLVDRTHAGPSTISSFNPYAQYNARYGIYSVASQIQDIDGKTSESYTLSAAGSLVNVGGFHGFSRPVTDSFGVVTTDGIPGIGIALNNEKVGTTDSSGRLVIPLNSYSANRVTVDTKNIPLNYAISSENWNILPPEASGTCIWFDAAKVQAVTGTLFVQKRDAKEPLEYYEITIKAGDKEIVFPTGKDGEFYIENILPPDAPERGEDRRGCRSIAERRTVNKKVITPGAYPASADYRGQKCEFQIVFPETNNMVSDIGEVTCSLVTMARVAVPDTLKPGQPVPVLSGAGKNLSGDNQSIVMKFSFKSAARQFTKKDKKTMASIVRQLEKNPDRSIMIEVYGDGPASGQAGERIGMKKAEAIRRYLTASGVKAERIRTVETAEKKNSVCGDLDQTCDKTNRGIVMKLVRKNEPAADVVRSSTR